jgi:hypothetical protein
MFLIGEIIRNIEVRESLFERKTNPDRLCVVAPYSKEHPVIQAFWRCVHEFTDDQKRKLLKFTTSCSRPPLFGFKVNIIK